MAMKPIAPKPFSTPKTKPTYKFKKAMPSPNRGKDPIQKGLEFFFGDKPKGKPSAPKPRGKLPGKPAPLATPRERTYPGGAKPAPMPKRVPNLSLPPDQRAKAKPTTPGRKVKTPTPAKPRPKAGLAKPPRKVTVTIKPKATPVPKFTAPSVAEFRKSAAYKTDSMTYKEYVDASYNVYKYKLKRGK